MTNFIEQTEKSKSEEATTFEGLLLEIVGQLLKAHPPDIIYLNRLFNELGNYQELWIERTLRTAIDLRNTLLKYRSFLFFNFIIFSFPFKFHFFLIIHMISL